MRNKGGEGEECEEEWQSEVGVRNGCEEGVSECKGEGDMSGVGGQCKV